MPSGVDAQSWIGFEHRIQERRFKALVETVKAAVAHRDGVAARVAFEEARELRPGAPELKALAPRVALLPTSAPAPVSLMHSWSRGLGAVSMFAVGVGLVIGLESLHPAVSDPAPERVAAAEPVSAVIPQVADAHVAPSPAVPLTTDVPTPSKAEATVPVTNEPKREEPVGTAGVLRASTAAAATAAVPNRSTFRPAVVEPEPVLSAGREVSDDYVAPSPRSEGRPGYAEATPTGPAIAANVKPQPVSVLTPTPATPAPAATVASVSAVPRDDSTRVAQVLNQYARAYGQLDPGAARAVWPSVDERALSRAFGSLESQDVSFDKCDIDVRGSLASASCRGTASYVGKIGSRQERTESRQWNFELKLHGDDWKIEKAQAYAR